MTFARTLTIPVLGRARADLSHASGSTRANAPLAREAAGAGGVGGREAPASHTLEARLVRGNASTPLAVIAPPHPLYGGTIGSPVVRALERAFQAAGHWTLAFNFRGVGESTGEPSGAPEDALADYLAVVHSVPDAQPAWLSGYSFGAAAALAAAIELEVPRVLLVAPQLGALDPPMFARYPGRLMVALASEDEYAPPDAVRKMCETRAETATQICIIEGADHFFLGSALPPLARVLETLIGAEAGA